MTEENLWWLELLFWPSWEALQSAYAYMLRSLLKVLFGTMIMLSLSDGYAFLRLRISLINQEDVVISSWLQYKCLHWYIPSTFARSVVQLPTLRWQRSEFGHGGGRHLLTILTTSQDPFNDVLIFMKVSISTLRYSASWDSNWSSNPARPAIFLQSFGARHSSGSSFLSFCFIIASLLLAAPKADSPYGSWWATWCVLPLSACLTRSSNVCLSATSG